MALERRDPGTARGHYPVGSSETDADGRYDFSRVSPGDYLVSANRLGPSPRRPYPRIYNITPTRIPTSQPRIAP